MLLQTNSYIVPRDKRSEHARVLRRFRQVLLRLGCDHFEVYEQVGANWNTGETTGRFVQILRFRDRKHQLDVQAAERADATAQTVVQEFCDLINFSYQQQQGLFAVGYYTSFLKMPPQRTTTVRSSEVVEGEPAAESEAITPLAEPGVVNDGSSQDQGVSVEGAEADDLDTPMSAEELRAAEQAVEGTLEDPDDSPDPSKPQM